MFGFSFEKTILLCVIAVFIIGPERLPYYAAQLARYAKALRDFAEGANAQVRDDLGLDHEEMNWKKLDPRQYDPRRIIRDALSGDAAGDDVAPVTAHRAGAPTDQESAVRESQGSGRERR
ncbi:MAG: sec-independent protein translocase protein TatB [Microbacteriaceae bacterium]|jgi:sec-independent protein translocase protein TatB|nr:sec-independent protein translocase protein TatB [Microbacteriaceae bacterium]